MEDVTDIVKELDDASAAAKSLMAGEPLAPPSNQPAPQSLAIQGRDALEHPRGDPRPCDVSGVQYSLPYAEARVAGWQMTGIRPRGRSGQFVEVREFRKG